MGSKLLSKKGCHHPTPWCCHHLEVVSPSSSFQKRSFRAVQLAALEFRCLTPGPLLKLARLLLGLPQGKQSPNPRAPGPGNASEEPPYRLELDDGHVDSAMWGSPIVNLEDQVASPNIGLKWAVGDGWGECLSPVTHTHSENASGSYY